MKDWCEAWLAALTRAWTKQMDIPLPERWSAAGRRGDVREAAAFPVLGWLCGAAAAVPAILTAMVFNRFAGAFVYALTAWILLTFRDSGRSDGMIAALGEEFMPGESLPWNVIVPVALMIGRFALLMLMFQSGNAWHLPLVCAGIFSMEALLTLDGGFQPPLLNDSREARARLWIAVAVLTLISFLLCRVPTALGAAAFAALWLNFQRRGERDGATLAQISLAGGVTGWVLLLAGLLAI